MNNFREFLKENKLDKLNTKELTYDEFLQSIIDSIKKDFKNTEKQAIEFTILYRNLLKNAWEKGYTTREAIASTKRPGVIIKEDKIDESYIFDIDTIYESYIIKINSEKKPENIKAYINEYFNKFNNESYSDKRIFERLKNNYKKLIKLADKRIFEMDYIKDDMTIDVDVIERNDELIDNIINTFSFVYKKKKDRYLRPIKITGKTLYNDIELEILLSNKDIIKIIWNNKEDTNELKTYINDNLIYHMDDINEVDIVNKSSNLYNKYLTKQNFKLNKKTNPFE